MNKYSILALIALIAVCHADNNCEVTLPRLLIGDKYSNPQNDISALILFDTIDECKQLAQLNFGDSADNFKYTVKDPVVQEVDAELSHNNQFKEQVKYLKFTQIIQVHGDVQKQYTVQIQGNKNDKSTIFATNYTFTLPKLGATNSNYTENGLKFLFFGDQDLTQNGTAVLNYLNDNSNTNKFDAMIFLGDYAYEFYQNNGQKGDQYIQKFAPLSFSYPLAMTPGNHEDNLNFTLFNEKFFLPGFSSTLNEYNSFNMGMVHFVHINLHYFSITDANGQQKMINWLKEDLGNVQRKNTPWIIAVGHKLTYCYDPYYKNNSQCVGYAEQFAPIDKILSQYGVDLFVVGHQHYNQVMAPMANQMIQDYSISNSTVNGDLTYTIQKSTGYITIVQGNGGCVTPAIPSKLRMLDIQSELKEASLFIDEIHYGYGYINVLSSTKLEYTSFDAINNKNLVKFTINTNHPTYSFSILSSFSLLSILVALFAL